MSRFFRVLSLVFVFVTVAFTTPLFALAGDFNLTKLVSDQPGNALITDPNLVNAWGIAMSAASPFWVSDNGTGVSTLYGGDVGGSPFTASALVVTIPGGENTGVIFNNTSDFVVTGGPAHFIFATEGGTIVGWSSSTAGTVAATVPNAVYKGIAIGNVGVANYLYVANFHSGAIDVFNNLYAPVSLGAGTFTDAGLPAGYAPFNIQNLGGTLYVTYAKQDVAMHDEVPGAGNGFVSKFDTSGNFLGRLISGGLLNAPWGMAIAPVGFTPFGGALLVGNFGDGTINAFDASTGALLGRLNDPLGATIAIDGLWGLTFGNGVGGGDTNALYFAAGPNSEADGLFGKLTVNALHATGTTVSPVATVPFSGVVASFTDDNPVATASNFTATIDWGDATATSPGLITSNGSGGFSVSGSHTYATQALFTITVTINDLGGASATATSTANTNSASSAPLFSPMTLLLLAAVLMMVSLAFLRRT